MISNDLRSVRREQLNMAGVFTTYFTIFWEKRQILIPDSRKTLKKTRDHESRCFQQKR